MRILITIILWAVIFCAGALTGNRYGMPEAATNVTDGGFESNRKSTRWIAWKRPRGRGVVVTTTSASLRFSET